MKTSVVVPITLCIFCYLLATVSAASISRPSAELELSRQYPELYEYILRQFSADQPLEYKRSCSDRFAGCAHLKLAKVLLDQNRRDGTFRFGSSGPGKRDSPDFELVKEKRRMGGCGDFSGCASLKAGRDLVRAMLRQPSKFGSGGPGKK
ncbi:hypothetical protein HOLleu_37037 [Holothuria leucospilota]|uniref:Uncharacterized protein n=1 Tax=Holothuria leucospilota TaxID=206669 RepID=A0A9Q0YKU6_HOLLE|nr:hypothetical protein HOLleu_37037 [Holothuria leucospilota]